eukprot:3971014-Amphidinium_carterae.1
MTSDGEDFNNPCKKKIQTMRIARDLSVDRVSVLVISNGLGDSREKVYSLGGDGCQHSEC